LNTPSHAQHDDELPGYTVNPILKDSSKRTWKEKLRRRWYIISIIVLIIIVSIVGGLVANRLHEKVAADGIGSDKLPVPLVTALTATECDSGSFVFHQVNSPEIYMHGQLWDGL
jgi:hypothetical protein